MAGTDRIFEDRLNKGRNGQFTKNWKTRNTDQRKEKCLSFTNMLLTYYCWFFLHLCFTK